MHGGRQKLCAKRKTPQPSEEDATVTSPWLGEPEPRAKKPKTSNEGKASRKPLQYMHGEFVDVKVDGRYYPAVIIKRVIQKQQRFCKCVVEWLDPANYP